MAHAENRFANRVEARRRTAALGCLLFADSLALAGCPSRGSKSDAKAPASRISSTRRPTSISSAAATASSTAGTVTATSLPGAQFEYAATAISTNLNIKQVAILQDFMAYDQMSWKLWVGGGQDTSKAPTVTTGSLQRQLINDVATLQNMGQKAKAPAKVMISEVATNVDGQSATVSYYVDMTQVTYVDAQGKDVTEPPNKARIPAKNTMVPGSNGHWFASEGEETGEPGTCKID